MATVTLCVYCEQLPERSGTHASRMMRCPLCHTELGITAGGAKFRVSCDTAANSPRHVRGLAIAAATFVVACAATALLYFVWLRSASLPTSTKTDANESPPPASPVSIVQAEDRSTIPLVNARAKPYLSHGRPGVAKANPLPQKAPPNFPDSAWAGEIREFRLASARQPRTSTTLRTMLETVPEVSLHEPLPKNLSKDEITRRTNERTKEVLDGNKEALDAFPRHLISTRPDLAGLPFLLGKACRLEQADARQFAAAAITVRSMADRKKKVPNSDEPAIVHDFWMAWSSDSSFSGRPLRREGTDPADPGVRALGQILSAGPQAVRLSLVRNLGYVKHPLSAKTLAKFAIHDLDEQVRAEAVKSLRNQSRIEYPALLVDAVRYPWAPAAENAAEAIVRLGLHETIPSLVAMLDENDPAAPFVVAKDGREVHAVREHAVREVVRINHHRNCLLCHAPVERPDTKQRAQRDSQSAEALQALVLAPIPSPAQPLPPAITPAYYYSFDFARGDNVVRADTTYLRQDFSLTLPVADSHPWPKEQRFDFMVRQRILGDKEAKELLARKQPAPSPQHLAALAALRGITGQDHGVSAAAWRSALGMSPDGKRLATVKAAP
jgi:hypothetical protein